MHASTILYGLVFLQGAMASPVGNAAAADVEPRATEPEGLETRDIERRAPALGDMPFPSFPSLKKSTKCAISDSCNNDSKVICCNNNNGYQMCIGEIDFNMPVTININIYKGGKGKNGGK
ncbi:hypothetical protein BFJ68_g9396 [Fusarium oxysporum]|uniref:Hydrophobin n=1 Tax=Fusarium oxysporum TaxID=5507 RepID=A0A420QV16_FUSOX|nr:hypothetical protein BFJ68_g9396 [Fusarium oxysporum]